MPLRVCVCVCAEAFFFLMFFYGNVILVFSPSPLLINLQPHPDVKPMAYANNFLRMFS